MEKLSFKLLAILMIALSVALFSSCTFEDSVAKFVPDDPDAVIEEPEEDFGTPDGTFLYMMGPGCSAGWNTDDAIPFPSIGDKVYRLDDVELLADQGFWFADAAGQSWPAYGSETGTDMNIKRYETESDMTFKASGDGLYRVTVNLKTMKLTCKFTAAMPVYGNRFWVSGPGLRGDYITFSPMETTDHNIFTWEGHLTNSGVDFFPKKNDWSGTYAKDNAIDAIMDEANQTATYTTTNTDNEKSSFGAPFGAGIYRITFNLAEKTAVFKVVSLDEPSTEDPTMYISGAPFAGGWFGTREKMTLVSGTKTQFTWTGEMKAIDLMDFKFYPDATDWGSPTTQASVISVESPVARYKVNVGSDGDGFVLPFGAGNYRIDLDTEAAELVITLLDAQK